MKQFARSSAPRSTARLSLSPQPAGISDLQGWCLGLLSIGLVALTLHFGHEPETRPATRRDDRKAEAHRGAVFELLQPPLIFYTVSAIVPEGNTHENEPTHWPRPASQTDGRRRQEGGRKERRRRIGSSEHLTLSIGAGVVSDSPRIEGPGVKVRYMTVSAYGYPGDHTNVRPLGGYKWDPNRLACAIRGGKIGDSVRIEWKGYNVVALIWDHLPGSRLDATPGLWKALGGGTYGLKKGAKVTFLGRLK